MEELLCLRFLELVRGKCAIEGSLSLSEVDGGGERFVVSSASLKAAQNVRSL